MTDEKLIDDVSADGHVVIIGSGPCGAMAAHALVKRAIPVTMLESGLRAPRGAMMRIAGHPTFRYVDGAPLRWDTGFTASLDPDTAWYRTLAGGGLSNYWTGAVPRFAPEDFSATSAEDAHRWPIGYDDLVEYYEQAEQVIGVTGDDTSMPTLPANVVRHRVTLDPSWRDIAEAASKHGHSLVPMPLAKGSPYMAVGSGTEFNSWHNVIADLRDSPFFALVPGAHVQRLEWDTHAAKVTSATYLDRESGRVRSMRGRSFVLAAGAVNSTRLLFASRSKDFPDGLGNTHDVLGRYLHDHPKDWWPLTTTGPLTLPAHPLYLTRSTDLTEFAASWTIGLATSRDRPKTYIGRSGNRFGVQVFGTMAPTPEHRVEVRSGSADELGQLPLNIHFGYEQSTIDNMRAARHRFTDILHSAKNTATVDGADVSLTPGESVHFGGSVRMHERPEFGMVDGNCRLHAASNVQVVDTSVFTTGPEKNPTLTAMAIAARAMSTITTP